MKIARIPILNAVTGEIESLSALFDTGSKRTYITECRAKLLQLQKGAKSTVNMNWDHESIWNDDTENKIQASPEKRYSKVMESKNSANII